jgi:hypothetical protein
VRTAKGREGEGGGEGGGEGDASARTYCPVHADAIFTASTDKAASADKCGLGRTFGRKGRLDGHFHPKTSVMTSLATANQYRWLNSHSTKRLGIPSFCRCHIVPILNLAAVLNARHPIMEKSSPCFFWCGAPLKSNPPFHWMNAWNRVP